MVTAMLSVDNLMHDAGHDVWAVNVEADYHEEHAAADARGEQGTGRSAPITPRRATAAEETG